MDHQILDNFSITINLEKSLKKWTFEQKSGVLFEKNPKNMTFHISCCSIQKWGIYYILSIFQKKLGT